MSEDSDVYLIKDQKAADRRYASRKFLFAATVWIGGTVGWAMLMMTTDQWIQFSKWTLGLYMAGNVGDTFVTGLSNKL
jgi:hypothetical protein